ncbi:hypothetical protein [Jidongwangia harbinensis]|uniref:hypothetical protein n=1 Tax=Jidongwangia harbinensis TaxID=2878561 RepID=UPI001CDA5364|nr:hypothetical protein [Jidongwangia harbinensis]MCA2217451.1 hypothetical protein [Jidongwangia harbinensis]
MSDQPRGHLWVDPEGVIRLGDAYADHGAIYDAYLAQLKDLRARYGNSWGDDDMGRQFSAKFLEGLDTLDTIVGSVKSTLDYTSLGLRKSGKLYRETDEQANEWSNLLNHQMEDVPQGSFVRRDDGDAQPQAPEQQLQARLHEAGTTLMPFQTSAPVQDAGNYAEPQHAAIATEKRAAITIQDRPAIPTMERGITIQDRPAIPTMERGITIQDRPAIVTEENTNNCAEPQHEAFMSTSLLPDEAGISTKSVEPSTEEHAVEDPASELMPGLANPLQTSGHFQDGRWHDAHIDGLPLADGFDLLGFSSFPDGTTRIDANLYQSISPITADHVITDRDGGPLDTGDYPLFVVKKDPTVDPTAPGYEPLYVTFAPDGTAVPLVTDL